MSASLLGKTLLERPPVQPAPQPYTPDGDYVPNIAILGWGRSGKDTVAAILHGMEVGGKRPFKQWGSTSWAALPEMAEKLDLPAQLAWDERHKNREFWKSHLDWLRRDNPLLLIQRVLEGGNLCVGVRDWVEIRAAIEQDIFDAIIWVNRPGIPVDPTVSYTREDLGEHDVIENDGTLDDLKVKVTCWAYRKGYLGNDGMS